METEVKIPEVFATQLQRGEMRIVMLRSGIMITPREREREKKIELHIKL